jgi:hypothetical protein
MPHAGDDLFRTKATLNPFLNYGATGPAHNWTFNNLAAADQDEALYQTVSSTNFVYAIAYADIFFNPNRANAAKQGVNIAFNDLLPIEDPYTFYYRSASTYREVGFGAELGGIPLPIIFDEQDEVYELPLNYGNTSSSHSAWKVSIPTLAFYGYQQQRTNEVDGWGTITTPAGSFDVLRVKTTLEGRDSINIDTLSLGFAIERPVVHEYKWLAQGLRVPVLQVNTAMVFGVEVITEIFFYDAPRTLAVAPPLGNVLCAGATVTVPYAATGVYNQGILFIPNNVFRAQLSDANGDFTNAVNIGSVTATVSGTITATIPANTVPGTGYRIRVTATSPGFTGTDNGQDITIALPPVAAATAGGDLIFCDGGSVMLSANAGDGLTYQWMLDGNDLDGATAADLDAAASGSYSVRVSNACGNDVSDAILVQVEEAPEHVLTPSSVNTCGEDVTIAAQNNTLQTTLTYAWTVDGDVLPDAQSPILITNEGGSYVLTVSNTVTGCSYTTAAATVIAGVAATPDVQLTGGPGLCPNTTALLSTDGSAASYAWYQDGNAIADANGPTYEAATAGDYTVVATSAEGCVSEPSAATTLTTLTAPDAPTVIASEPTTFCAGGAVTLIANVVIGTPLQWSFNGLPIDGATENQLVAAEAGLYAVQVTGDNGCTNTSDATPVVVNPVPEQPVITQQGDSLSASGDGSFQWYLNGSAIDGATDASYAVLVSGDYTVVVTDANGCNSTSEVYTYLSTGIDAHAAMQVGVSPNPSNGAFTITWPSAQAGASFVITDAAGRRVQEGRVNGTTTRIDLSGQPAGLYLLRSLSDGSTVRLLLN